MLSIVIPAYNEERRLPATLTDILNYVGDKGLAYEIIVVSDGSTDQTEAVVRALAMSDQRIKLLINEKNRGKGYSVRRGVLVARGEQVLFMDADNSTRIKELDVFCPLLNDYDVVIGSRALAASKIVKHQPWLRERTGKLFNLFVRIFFLSGINDTQCGFKLFRRPVAIEIFKRAKLDRFIFDVEVLMLARQLGYKIVEAPVVWENSKPSKVSFWHVFVDIILGLIALKIAFRKRLTNNNPVS